MNHLISAVEAAEGRKANRNTKSLRLSLGRVWEHAGVGAEPPKQDAPVTPLSLWQRSPDGTVKHSKIQQIKAYSISFIIFIFF